MTRETPIQRTLLFILETEFPRTTQLPTSLSKRSEGKKGAWEKGALRGETTQDYLNPSISMFKVATTRIGEKEVQNNKK